MRLSLASWRYRLSAWLDRTPKIPKERVEKDRLKDMLGKVNNPEKQ
jgi:hypothetical protein